MTFYYRVEGRVQGVAFRYLTSREALRLGITGTVKNLPDGSVEIYACSNPELIIQFESYIKSSPGRSEVKKIVKKKVCPDFELGNFSIIY